MREVIDYSKDFLSGETIERKRNKEDVNYRGIATIQLFDEKGNIVQEVKSENMINSKWLSFLYISFFRVSLIYNTSSLDLSYKSPARCMILTTNSEAEEVNNIIKGDLIGWANGWESYSGDNALRGSVNTAETSNTDFKKHFVIDFPTNAANGTFQSIYWLPLNTPPSYCVFKLERKLGTFSEKNDLCYFAVYDGYIYGCEKTSKPTYINKVDMKTFKVVKRLEEIDTAGDFMDLKIGDGKVYYFTREYANVYDLDLNFIEKIIYSPLDTTKKFTIYDAEGYEDGFVLTQSGNKRHLFDFRLNEVRELPVFDELGSDSILYIGNGMFTTGFGSFPQIYPIKYYDINKDVVYKWTGESAKFHCTPDDPAADSSTNLLNYPYYDWHTEKIYCRGPYNQKDAYYSVYEGSKIPWFAHTLLPAPVTKTATNTMKIQYDFIVEERGYFD